MRTIGIYTGKHHIHSGGGYTFIDGIINTIKKENFSDDKIVVFTYTSGKADIKINEKLKIISLVKFKPSIISRLFNKMARLIKRISYFIKEKDFYYFEPRNTPLKRAVRRHKVEIMWFLSFEAEDLNIPYIYTVWDMDHRIHPYFPEISKDEEIEKRDAYYHRYLRRAARIVTGTRQGCEEISFFYNIPSSNISAVPLFSNYLYVVKNDNNEEKINIKVSEPFLFYPAQFWAHKNHIVLIEMMNILKQKGQFFSMVFTGTDKGNYAYLQKTINKFNLQDRIILPGFLSANEIVYLYKHAFALLMPTYFGPDNLPPLEAFSSGCPVIASDIPGTREQLNEAAIFVSPSDPSLWAEAVIALKKDKDFRQKMIDKGYELVRNRKPDDYIRKIFKIIEEIKILRNCWE